MDSNFKVLIAEDDEILSSLYEMLIKSEITNSVFIAKDGSLASKKLGEDSDINLVISDFDMPYKNGDALYLKDIKPKKIPTILITGRTRYEIPHLEEFESDNVQNIYIKKPADIPVLLEHLKAYKNNYEKNLSRTKQIELSVFEKYLKENDFTPIPVAILKRFGSETIDVYVKLHVDRLTKIIAKENSGAIDQTTLDEYRKKGITEVYLKKNDFLAITKNMMNELALKARQNKKVTPVDIAGLQVNVSLHNLKELGINNEQISTVNEILEESLQTIFSDKSIEAKMKAMMKDYNYHTSHSVLLMYVASNILKKTTLPYQNTLKKIALAAFFHDLSIDNEIAESEMQVSGSKIEPNSFLNKQLIEHPYASAKLLKTNEDDTFNEANRIIQEHHETPNGNGYPRGLNATQIAPLSALFIISHEIANNLYRNDYNNDMLNLMLRNAEKDYAQGNFKNFFEATKKAFLS